MNPIYEKLIGCYESIREKIPFVPKTALVLGSGLGGYADTDNIRIAGTLDYRDMEGFPRSTVEGHKGRFVFGYVGEVPVVCMQGRVHYYEGYAMSDVVLPIRLMRKMGAEILLLTNAAGVQSYTLAETKLAAYEETPTDAIYKDTFSTISALPDARVKSALLEKLEELHETAKATTTAAASTTAKA